MASVPTGPERPGLRARLYDVRRGEWPKVIGMGLFFFLVTMTFWVIKPIKRGLLLGVYADDPLVLFGMSFGGAEAEQLAKALNVAAAFVAVVGLTLLTRRVRRDALVVITCGVFAVAFALAGLRIAQGGPALAWSLYVLGDMFNSVMLTIFWALMHDLVRSEQAGRLYGLIGLGGVLGGFVGATVVASAVEPIGRAALMFALLVPLAAMATIAVFVHRRASSQPGQTGAPIPASPGKSAVVEGAGLVFASPYLLGIAGIILLYECVSNIVDFQLASAVQMAGLVGHEKDEFFALVGQVTNMLAVVVQLVVTTWVMRRFGVKTALLCLPIAVVIGSMGFLAVASLPFALMMSAADSGLNYSINQSAKESLYVPLSRAEKYKAKAFIDMFVQRSAKLVAVGLNLVVVAYIGVAKVHLLSWATLGLLALWIALVVYLGRGFERRAMLRGSPEPRRERGLAAAELTAAE